MATSGFATGTGALSASLPPIARRAAGDCARRASATRTGPTCCWRSWPQGTTVAGCFTTSKSRSAPVDWCVDSSEAAGSARALVVNAGNANAFTGKAGVATVTAVANAAAKHLKCKPRDIFQASTGVIGEPLNPSPITDALPQLMEAARSDALERSRPRDHDHRHLREGLRRSRRSSAARRSPSTASPRARA